MVSKNVQRVKELPRGIREIWRKLMSPMFDQIIFIINIEKK